MKYREENVKVGESKMLRTVVFAFALEIWFAGILVMAQLPGENPQKQPQTANTNSQIELQTIWELGSSDPDIEAAARKKVLSASKASLPDLAQAVKSGRTAEELLLSKLETGKWDDANDVLSAIKDKNLPELAARGLRNANIEIRQRVARMLPRTDNPAILREVVRSLEREPRLIAGSEEVILHATYKRALIEHLSDSIKKDLNVSDTPTDAEIDNAIQAGRTWLRAKLGQAE